MNKDYFFKIKTREFCISFLPVVLFLLLICFFGLNTSNESVWALDEVPEIIVDTTDWTVSVEVTIVYPVGQTERKYSIVRNGIDGTIENYESPFNITTEGNIAVKAYYGDKAYVERLISNVDRTLPSEPEIRLEINLMRTQNVLLKVHSIDNKSGIDRVIVSAYGYPFNEKDSWYELDLTHITIEDSFSIDIFDKVGNRRIAPYVFTAYDYLTDIRNHAYLYQGLGDGSQYTRNRWAEIINKFKNLEIAYENPLIDSSEINTISLQLEELIEGKFNYYTQIIEPIVGMDSNIIYSVSSTSLDAPLGSAILMEISNSTLAIEERENMLQILSTLSGYKKIKLLPFNLTLKEKTGETVRLIGSMNIEFTIPEGYSRAKLYGYSEGVLSEIILASSDGKKSAKVNSDGDFFLVLDEDSKLAEKGYVFKGHFYSYALFWGVIGGILGLMLVTFALTYLLIHNKDKLSRNKLLSKINKQNRKIKKAARK